MRELSLFSGAGGWLLGTKLLGWTHCGYVEYNDYCQRVIRARIDDGILDDAPIFGDIRTFISDGYADSYQGMVDVVTGGFPCQPFSVAGKQQGADDSRNMWPETLAVLRIIRPRFTFLENVPGLLAHPYARRIFGDLAESGFDARWRVLSAAECGAPHKRDRVWIYCHANEYSESTSAEHASEASELPDDATNTHNASGRRGAERRQGRDGEPALDGEEREVVADSDAIGRNGWAGQFSETHGRGESANGRDTANTGSAGLEGRQPPGGTDAEHAAASGPCWWESEPDVGRVANGVAARVDRLKAIGNGQVSIVAATAWNLLNVG